VDVGVDQRKQQKLMTRVRAVAGKSTKIAVGSKHREPP